VTVDIVESFWDAGHSSVVPRGGYDVEVADGSNRSRFRFPSA
jgi:hypothetical protein